MYAAELTIYPIIVKFHCRRRKSGKLLKYLNRVLYDSPIKQIDSNYVVCACLLGKPHEGNIAKRLRVVSGRHVLVGFTNENSRLLRENTWSRSCTYAYVCRVFNRAPNHDGHYSKRHQYIIH